MRPQYIWMSTLAGAVVAAVPNNFQTLAYVYADFWDGSYDDAWLNRGAPRYSC